MAGHSKWANIKHKKAKEDAKRGKVFTRLIRELTIAARHGGSDPGSNPRLRLAITKAQAENMSKDTMDRAIKLGAGELGGAQTAEIRSEGYGPRGASCFHQGRRQSRHLRLGRFPVHRARCALFREGRE